MLTAETREALNREAAKRLHNAGLPAASNLGGPFRTGEIRLVYTHRDQMIVRYAVPGVKPLLHDPVAKCSTASELEATWIGEPAKSPSAASHRRKRELSA
jgi:4-deoxy-L-threo-5-hexosulose-uronate ketol-isomerase